jgi:hypothetical protein
MFLDYSVIFKYLRTYNHFWFYCFILLLFPISSIKFFINFHFKYVSFSKTFSSNTSWHFFYFFKLVAKEYLTSMIYKILKLRIKELLEFFKKKK